MEFLAEEEKRERGGKGKETETEEVRERKERDSGRGRRGGVGGWERQVFGSELSLILKRGDVHRK